MHVEQLITSEEGGRGGGDAGRTEAAYTYSACVYRDYGSFVCYTITNTENGRTADMRKYYNYYEIKGMNTDDSGWDYISLFTKRECKVNKSTLRALDWLTQTPGCWKAREPATSVG